MNRPDPDLIATLLRDDPVWSAYALADLQPEMAPHCRWYVHANNDASAVALVFDGLEPPILFAKGDTAALGMALSEAVLPEQVYLSVRNEHTSVLARWYNHHDRRPMWRMVLVGDRDRLRGANDDVLNTKNGFQLRQLTSADVVSVKRLFRHGGPFTPDAFAAHQVDSGVFYGIEDKRDELAAVGGTHIVDYTARIAAIGNMYTRPDCRGRGFAGAVLGAIVDSLCAGDIETIVLNVDQRNTAARRIYERFGFVVHCPYIEGVATAIN